MFKNPFSFEGRIRRTEFGISLLISILPIFLIKALRTIESFDLFYPTLPILYTIVFYLFILAQSAKRCHDTNRSGWFQFIPFFIFWLIFEEGNAHSNQYGPNPKDSNSLSINNNQSDSFSPQNTSSTNNSVTKDSYNGGHNSQNDSSPTDYNQNYS
jgi:uncharacterized membrane protein YhaH (DUF805 family)